MPKRQQLMGSGDNLCLRDKKGDLGATFSGNDCILMTITELESPKHVACVDQWPSLLKKTKFTFKVCSKVHLIADVPSIV